MVLSPTQCHFGWFIYTTWQKSPSLSWTASLWMSHWICLVEHCVPTNELESKVLKLDGETIPKMMLPILPHLRHFPLSLCVVLFIYVPVFHCILLKCLSEPGVPLTPGRCVSQAFRLPHVPSMLNFNGVCCLIWKKIGIKGLAFLAISVNTFTHTACLWLQ